MIRDLATAIIRDGKVPTDWEESFIIISLSTFTRARVMLWIEATIEASS